MSACVRVSHGFDMSAVQREPRAWPGSPARRRLLAASTGLHVGRHEQHEQRRHRSTAITRDRSILFYKEANDGKTTWARRGCDLPAPRRAVMLGSRSWIY